MRSWTLSSTRVTCPAVLARRVPTAEEVYRTCVEALLMDEDEQLPESLIIALLGPKLQPAATSTDFLHYLVGNPTQNVVVLDHLQHGKTMVMDMLIE